MQRKLKLDQYFGLSERKTSLNTEILAGTTTFLAMAYIIFVNPHILGWELFFSPGSSFFF